MVLIKVEWEIGKWHKPRFGVVVGIHLYEPEPGKSTHMLRTTTAKHRVLSGDQTELVIFTSVICQKGLYYICTTMFRDQEGLVKTQ
jgi:hypothetical protein